MNSHGLELFFKFSDIASHVAQQHGAHALRCVRGAHPDRAPSLKRISSTGSFRRISTPNRSATRARADVIEVQPRMGYHNGCASHTGWLGKECGISKGGGRWALRPRAGVQLGSITESMTWMTPLLAGTSVFMTLALSTVTTPSLTFTSSDWPFTVLACIGFTSAAMTLPGTTW